MRYHNPLACFMPCWQAGVAYEKLDPSLIHRHAPVPPAPPVRRSQRLACAFSIELISIVLIANASEGHPSSGQLQHAEYIRGPIPSLCRNSPVPTAARLVADESCSPVPPSPLVPEIQNPDGAGKLDPCLLFFGPAIKRHDKLGSLSFFYSAADFASS
jgi:hypothetical protein